MSNAITESGAHYYLTLRSERPIESCELFPNAFLQLKGGSMDNSTRAKLLDSEPYYFSFSWSRGPKRPICNNPSCPRAGSYEPTSWSKASLGGPELVCSICFKAGEPVYNSSFCCRGCFLQSWKVHSAKHSKITANLDYSETDIDLNGVPETSADNTDDPSAWLNVCSEKSYTAVSDDVGCRLRIEVQALAKSDDRVLAGPVIVFTDTVLASPGTPPKRRLITLPGAGTGISGAIRFRVISYNILAELYATKQAYPYCDSWSLMWPYRKKIICSELEEAQGDIVCLQEVQADYYDQHICPFMTELGYDGIFKQKSRDFVGQYGKVDGCATFWKRSKFMMTENYAIEFNELARQESVDLGFDESEARRFMNRLSRDNIAQVIVLESLSRPAGGVTPGRGVAGRTHLCVVNTHLYANHQRPDVKLWQTMNLMREIEQFIATRDLPLLLCGDFNSEPYSAVYEYLIQGAIQTLRPELDVAEHGTRVLPMDLQSYGHNIELASAMSTVFGGEPYFTNYTAKFKGTLDYIFYTPSKLRILAVSDMPEEYDLIATSGDGLPSSCYPSDHLMLCTDVAISSSGGNGLSSQNGKGQMSSGMMRGPTS